MLKVGSVLYGMCDTSNPPKRKFHIIVAEDMDSYAYVFINSNVVKAQTENKLPALILLAVLTVAAIIIAGMLIKKHKN